jgi:hypothetical protein
MEAKRAAEAMRFICRCVMRNESGFPPTGTEAL